MESVTFACDAICIEISPAKRAVCAAVEGAFEIAVAEVNIEITFVFTCFMHEP